METLCEHGASTDIIYDAMPHVGTDMLTDIVMNLRKSIIKMGGEFYFDTKLEEILFDKDGSVRGIVVREKNKEREIHTQCLILAIGHSARDTFKMLKDTKVSLEPKPFAVGYRVAHLQENINEAQYGKGWKEKGLPSAYYKLTHTLNSKRAVYSFCMCPGGYIVNASSKDNMLCVNGMSYSRRDGKYANSAVVIGISADDILNFNRDFGIEADKTNPLIGMYFQNEIEKRAYEIGNGSIPFSYLGATNNYNKSVEISNDVFKGKIKFTPNMISDNIILPRALNKDFIDGMEAFSKQIHGFDSEDTIICGVEGRTSSPVRIMRNELGEAIGHKGLYPCGEGAGFAGGIMSAAMDGVKAAIKAR